MFLVREVFHCKPGKAKELVNIFKSMVSSMEEHGVKNVKIMTDSVSTYWTVVMESEVEDLNTYLEGSRNPNRGKGNQHDENTQSMTDYRDLVIDGHREIFKIE